MSAPLSEDAAEAIWNFEEVKKITGFSRHKIYNSIHRGPTHGVDRAWIIRGENLFDYLSQRLSIVRKDYERLYRAICAVKAGPADAKAVAAAGAAAAAVDAPAADPGDQD